jgi:hypothetical protein
LKAWDLLKQAWTIDPVTRAPVGWVLSKGLFKVDIDRLARWEGIDSREAEELVAIGPSNGATADWAEGVVW